MTAGTAHLQVVVPFELAVGFQIGGASVHPEEDATGAATVVQSLIAEGEQGVIAVYEPWLTSFDRRDRESLEESVSPVIVAIPSGLEADAGTPSRARLAALLQRAVGYRITFEEEE